MAEMDFVFLVYQLHCLCRIVRHLSVRPMLPCKGLVGAGSQACMLETFSPDKLDNIRRR